MDKCQKDAPPRPNTFPQSSAVRYNTRIGIGGENRDLVVFDLEWHVDVIRKDMARIKHRQMVGYEENPRLARTVDEEPEQHTEFCKYVRNMIDWVAGGGGETNG